MTRRFLVTIAAISALAFPGLDVEAQGALSTQGFGYPPGALSTRVRSTGGSLGEFDPDSPLNPASIGTSGDPRMFFQYEPERRRIATGGESSNTLTARFPLASGSAPIRRRGSVGISYSTFLDRSSSTTLSTEQEVAGQVVSVVETNRVEGAINDARLAIGYAPSQRLQLGIGGHIFVGQNRLFFTQLFPDTLDFTPVAQVSTVSYTGSAVSAGVLVRPSRHFGVGLSARKGFGIEAENGDTTVSRADIPDRISAGAVYEGIPGTSISARVSRELWSSLNGLGSSAATAVDAWEGSLGAEALGPRLINRQTILRIGGRYRTLPFLAAGSEVTELSVGGGIGMQFFRNRATFDFSVERAGRSPKDDSLDVSERAYILSFGLRVRP